MKNKLLERLTRHLAPPAHLVALLLATLAATSAWAITADAVWEGGFTANSTKTGASGITYTLNLNGNTSDATGDTLPISANLGAKISLSSSSANLAVLVKYSALNAAPAGTYELAAIRVKDKGWPGLRVASENGYDITGFYENANTQTYGFSVTPKLSSTGGYFLLCHQGGSQTGGYAGSTLQQLSGGTTTSLKWGTNGTTLDTIVLGGPSATGLATSAYSGLVIEKVAIFNQVVTGADLATYTFPSEDPATTYDYTATISANTTFSDITWTTGTGTPGTDAKVYIEAQNNAVLTIGGTFDVGTLWVSGGSIAFDTGTTVSSTKIVGAPINIATETVNFSDSFLASAINTTGACTINFTDCEIYGGITAAQNGDATINTYGNVVFGDIADNYFKYRTTFCVKSGSTTTYNSKSDRRLWCTVRVEKNATLINERQDSFDYNSNASYPIHAYIYGTLTLNQKWTVGKCARYIHLYDGALINGSAENALHSNNSGYACDFIAEEGTSTITAPFVKGEGTINVVTKENAMLVLSTSQALAKSGAGTLRIKNTHLVSDISGSEGVLELYNDSGENKTHYNTISFAGTIKATRENSSKSHNVFGNSTENTTATGQDLILTGMPKLEIAGTQAYLCLNAQLANQNLSVKNLTYEGNVSDAKVDPVFNDGTSTGNMAQIKTIKTKQTEDTICNLIFSGEANSGKRQSGLYVYGDMDAVHSLTLTKESTTFGPLTVENYGKVIFSGSGKWANGTVTVGVNGVLEAQHAAALGVVTLQDGATFVVPTVSSAVVPLTGTTVTLPTSGTVNVDLTGVTVAEGESVTVISATSLVNANASIFRQTEGGWRFSVDNNTIKATKLGTVAWSDGTWSDSDFTGYATASIVASGTQDVTLPASATFDTLTITGSGTVTLTSTSSETCTVAALSIGAGVTLNASSSLVLAEGCAITGEGVLNIPANTTFAMNGVTCSTKVTVAGTLETSGETTLSAANTSAAGSLIEVVNGVTTLSSSTCGLSGNITIQSDGELKFAASYNASGEDLGWDYLGTSSSNTVKVYGKLNMPNCNLWLRANNTLELYQGAEVLGSGSYASYGSLIWAGNASLMAYGDAEIKATITTLTDCSPVFNVAENKTLTISTAFIGQAVTITDNPTRISGGSLTKAGAGTLCLKNVAMTKPISGSEGTLQLLSDASGVKTHTATSSFSGKVIITRNSGGEHHEIGTTADDDSNPGVFFLSGSPELEINGSAAYLCLNRSFAGKYMMVKNLSATSGTIDAKYTSGGTSKTIKCLQTEDTTYAGNFNGGGTTARYVDLLVYGQNETVKTLTLSGASGTMNSYGTLTVKDYGKVKFSGSGDWAAGTVVVGANGYLESSSSAATLASALTLQDGATMSFVSGYSLQTGTLTLPASGSVTVDVTAIADAIAESGATGVPLITVTSGIDASTDISALTDPEGYYLAPGTNEIRIYPLGAILHVGETETKFASVDAAVTQLQSESNKDAYVEIVSGTCTLDPATLASADLIYDSSEQTYHYAAAQIGSTNYGTLSAAVAAAAASGDTVTLLRDTAEQNVDVSDKEITLVEGEYTFSGSFTGGGTIVMTTVPKAISTSMWAAGWEGVLWLKNYTFTWKAYDPVVFGNSTSTLRMTGCSGSLNTDYNSAGRISQTTLELQDEGNTVAFSITDGFPTYGFTSFAKLTGTGTLAGNDSSRSQCYHFADASDFRGSITIGSSSSLRVILGGDTSDTKSGDYKKIWVEAGSSVSVAAGKTWTAPSGFIINGTVSVAETGALSNNSISGAGTIAYAAVPSTEPTFDSSWTGKVELAGFTAAGQKLHKFGVAGSTIVLKGDVAGWLGDNSSQQVPVAAKLQLDANLTISAISTSWTYTFAELTGSGNFSITATGSATGLTITKVASTYSGTISNSSSTTLNIGTLELTSTPTTGTKILSTGGTGTISVGAVTVNGEAADFRWESRSDGVYVRASAVASYGGTDYDTIAEAIAAAESDGKTYADVTILDESAECPAGYYLSGPAGSKELTRCAARSGEEGSYVYYNDFGAIYNALAAQRDLVLTVLDGNGAEYESALKTFFPALTYNETDQTLYIVVAKIGETGYRSFAAAIDAATSGQTIQLISSSSEAITLDKTIILSGASYFEKGTFTGTGKVTLDALMQQTIVAAGWSGTIVLPEVSGVLNLAYYGVSGSTVELTSMSGYFQHTGSTYNFNIAPNIKVSGSCTLLSEATSGLNYSFQTISGTGTLTLNNSANSISVAKVSDFSGSIVNNSATALTIARLELSAAPTAGQCVLTTGGTGTVNVSSVYVGNTQQDVILEKKTDGIYVAATKSTAIVDEENVTVLDTGSNTAIDATGVSGKVAIPGTVTQISGVAAADLLLKVTYTPDGGTTTTKYYSGILALDNGNVSLDRTADVGGASVKVEPTMATASAPAFTITTIPGLWYAVETSDTAGGEYVVDADTISQAVGGSTVLPAADAPGSGNVKYYKIVVGASRQALE